LNEKEVLGGKIELSDEGEKKNVEKMKYM